ncbi:MAG TPA: phosphoenolpyruvate--protein phosphotransferase [Myxococcales bacterium]|nr:phosphoenolpyruvate--protein phosphotransferase [Myxococcales bacterium]HIN85580.1 phosphoenolpyruvate--protein phosphotransferase [Myxococcales bacterium]
MKATDGTIIEGIGASQGIAQGNAVLLDRRRVTFHKQHIKTKQIATEKKRFMEAVNTSVSQLQQLRQQVAETFGGEHLEILDAHELMLQDELLISGTVNRIKEERINAEWALMQTLAEIKAFFNQLEDEYFRERQSDVEFIGDRIMRNLTGQQAHSLLELIANLEEPSILVAYSLSPAETIQLRDTHIQAICTADGTKTAHTAIVARSMELPAVVGLRGITDIVGSGDMLIVDGDNGRLCIRPSGRQKKFFARTHEKVSVVRNRLNQQRQLDAVTPDRFEVQLRGNVDLIEEIDGIVSRGASGIGLYRTEYLFLNRRELPTEEEQFVAYKQVLQLSNPHSATIRTLDIGGDKLEIPTAVGDQLNPFFGLRAIRYCLKEKTLFLTQLRALLRASVFGRLRILIPFVTDISEIWEVRELLETAGQQLRAEGYDFRDDIELGAMIEIPSAAMIADILARHVDFFSVGTNDLIQYILAISRDTTEIDYLYHPLHPAVLRVLRMVSDAAHREGICLSMCGEMAGDPLYTAVLLGLRFHELSMSARSIPVVREIIQRTRLKDARILVDSLFHHNTYQEVEKEVWNHMALHFPDLEPILKSSLNTE